MRKSKRGSELFEVLNRGSEPDKQFEVPRWWSPNARRRGGTGSENADAPQSPEGAAPTRAPGSIDGREMTEPAGKSVTRALELDGNRLRISLTSLSAALIIAVGVMLLAVSFRVGRDRGFVAGRAEGRASYLSGVGDEIERVRQGPANRELLAGLQEATAYVEEPPAVRSSARFVVDDELAGRSIPAGPVWVRDYTYINVQGFEPGSGGDAEDVQAFLAERGIDTAIIPIRGGKRLLLTTQGYDNGDSAQRGLNEALLKRVRSLGAKYNKLGGQYNWHDAYFKKLTKDSW